VSKSQTKTLIVTFFDIKGIVHLEFIPQGQTVNQTYCVDISKQLHEAMCRKRPEIFPSIWILHSDTPSANKALTVKQFLAQKSITEIEHPPCSPHLAPDDFWLFPKSEPAVKRRRFQHIEDIQKRDKCTGSSSITGVPKMFPTVTGSFIGLSA
jgi:histone-lysine N-methyltransferase SETMAR